MADNVTTLYPLRSWSIEIFEQRDGWMVIVHRNGEHLFDYKSESFTKMSAMVMKTVGSIDDSSG